MTEVDFRSLFTCPGIELLEPENLLACYRAGHRCEPVRSFREVRDELITVRYACPCCGSVSATLGYPKEWVDNNPNFENQMGDIARRLNDD